MGRVAVAFALALAFAGAAPPRGTGGETQLQHALDGVVAAGVPGAVLLVREGNRTMRLTSGYGNLKPRTAMGTGDRFRVGSITKTFVATVVLQLVGERKLALDDTVERRAVDVAAVQDGIAVVTKGLSAGEQVVVDGQYRLTNGARIKRSAPQTG